MPYLATAITGLAYSRPRDLRNGFGLISAKPGGVALPVAVSAVQFTVGSVMMEGALWALGQVSSIGFCWYKGSRNSGGMDSHSLLVLGGRLS